ncbi:MAG: TerB family tellurite resistance protein [Ignavibacteriae bacterium]|nr:TerB family tellurite resistance protein [Ignavibacteriota bacterium]
MLEFILNALNTSKINSDETSKKHALKVAACALFLEVANIDDNISESEEKKIINIMRNNFKLSDDEIALLISKSKEEVKKSVSIYEFTEIVNKNFDSNEKYNLIKNLWQIAFADGNLDMYEEHYIKKICNNLFLTHKDRIAAKLEVKTELGL